MSRAWAVATFASLAIAMLAAFIAPWPFAAALLAVAVLFARRGRVGLALFFITSATLGALALGFATSWSTAGMFRGAEGGLRLSAAAAVNIALLSWISPARLLDDLRLSPRMTAVLAAVLLAAADIGRDATRLRDARRFDGAWPTGRFARIGAAAALLPALALAAHERARIRADALQLAGHRMGPSFVPIVAISALAAAGRLAFVALPNVALSFVVIFLGGVLFGARVGVIAGALSMLLTNLLLTGLYPPSFVNVPAMALVGLVGGAFARVDLLGASRADRAAATVFAAVLGVLTVLLFSVAADSATWALLYWDTPSAWLPLVAFGLVFNIVPAFVNGAVFALALMPTVGAFQAAGRTPRRQSTTPTGTASPDDAPAAQP